MASGLPTEPAAGCKGTLFGLLQTGNIGIYIVFSIYAHLCMLLG